jgi:hypothetical protein
MNATFYYVARGRTVYGNDFWKDAATGKGKKFGPGDRIDLDPTEAARLMASGFVQTEPPIFNAVVDPGSNPGNVGPQNMLINAQGPTYTR